MLNKNFSYNHLLKSQGIYAIINTINRKIYIGSSKNMFDRCYGHFCDLISNKHYNEHLQNSWNKFFGKCFLFETIEVVENKNDLFIRENFWATFFNSLNKKYGYNLMPIISGCNEINEETRLKMKFNSRRIDFWKLKDEDILEAVKSSKTRKEILEKLLGKRTSGSDKALCEWLKQNNVLFINEWRNAKASDTRKENLKKAWARKTKEQRAKSEEWKLMMSIKMKGKNKKKRSALWFISDEILASIDRTKTKKEILTLLGIKYNSANRNLLSIILIEFDKKQ